MTNRKAGPSFRRVVMSLKRIPSVGKSLISRILARSSAISMARPPYGMPSRLGNASARLLADSHPVRAPLLEKGPRSLLRLTRAVGGGKGVDAQAHGGGQIG